ncbi:Ig domain-containing protein [Bradyrhizobium sp.]|uniref:Ig domain-containing protein n=1 Tax=Bradyrhizobium sp. TaxID=376 RepID=UPI0039E672D6
MKRTIFLGLVAAGLLLSGSVRATQLITEEEAHLPPPKGAVAADRRGIMRGPKVEFVSPSDSVSSPLKLVLKFESFGGAKIDPDSVKVIFLRSPNVDLTQRVKPFVQADGINMQDAELPPGEYTVRVDIKDSDGRPGTTIFTLKVAPK